MSTTVGEGVGGCRDQMLTDVNFTESEKFFVCLVSSFVNAISL